MRKSWLGLVSLLVGGGAAQAQHYPMPFPSDPRMAPPAMPASGYPGGPPQGPMFQPIPGYAPQPGGPYAPSNGGHYRPSGPMMAPPGYPSGPMPPAPTVPIVPPGVNMGLGDDSDIFQFHRPHDETLWVRTDFLMTWIPSGPLDVPLVTTGSTADPAPAALNPANAGTAVLFGNGDLDFGVLGGVRLEVGAWLDCENTYSVDAGFMLLVPSTIRYSAASDPAGNPVLGRPIFNAITGQEGAFLVSQLNDISGSVSVAARTDMWGIEANTRRHFYFHERLHVEGLVGFRTLALRESIRIQDNIRDLQGGFLTFNGTPLGAGDTLFEQDLFRTENQFYGIQVGNAWTYERDWFDFNLFGKFAVGVTNAQTVIDGFATVGSATLGNQTVPGGILGQITNNGERNRYVFGMIPEAGGTIGINLHRNIRFNAGYTFLLWNNVIRPGSLIDRTVNPGLVPGSQVFGAAGPARPAYQYQEQSFITHTLNFGLEFHF